MVTVATHAAIDQTLNIVKEKSRFTLNLKSTMDNWWIILVSAGMIMLFIGPFFIFSSVKDRKRARRKHEK
jgi:hypothetical protein